MQIYWSIQFAIVRQMYMAHRLNQGKLCSCYRGIRQLNTLSKMVILEIFLHYKHENAPLQTLSTIKSTYIRFHISKDKFYTSNFSLIPVFCMTGWNIFTGHLSWNKDPLKSPRRVPHKPIPRINSGFGVPWVNRLDWHATCTFSSTMNRKQS